MSNLESIGLEVPNLDCFTIDPKEVAELGNILWELSQYCRCKALAMQERLAGDIVTALKHERECEKFYKHLPNWAKW